MCKHERLLFTLAAIRQVGAAKLRKYANMGKFCSKSPMTF